MARYKKHPSNTHPPVCSSFSSDKRDRFIPLLGDRNTGGEVMREIYYDWKFIRQFFLLLSAKVQPGNTQIFVNCKWKNPSIRRQALIANRELIQNIQKLWGFFIFQCRHFLPNFIGGRGDNGGGWGCGGHKTNYIVSCPCYHEITQYVLWNCM